MNTLNVILIFLTFFLILCFIIIYNTNTNEGFYSDTDTLKNNVRSLETKVQTLETKVQTLETNVQELKKKLMDIYTFLTLDYNSK